MAGPVGVALSLVDRVTRFDRLALGGLTLGPAVLGAATVQFIVLVHVGRS